MFDPVSFVHNTVSGRNAVYARSSEHHSCSELISASSLLSQQAHAHADRSKTSTFGVEFGLRELEFHLGKRDACQTRK